LKDRSDVIFRDKPNETKSCLVVQIRYCTSVLRDIGNYSPSGTASHPAGEGENNNKKQQCSGNLVSRIVVEVNFNSKYLLLQDFFLCHNTSVPTRGNCMPSSILKQCVVYQRTQFHSLLSLLDERRALHNKMSEPKFKVNLHFISNAVIQTFPV
jgi:hypothetical protein